MRLLDEKTKRSYDLAIWIFIELWFNSSLCNLLLFSPACCHVFSWDPCLHSVSIPRLLQGWRRIFWEHMSPGLRSRSVKVISSLSVSVHFCVWSYKAKAQGMELILIFFSFFLLLRLFCFSFFFFSSVSHLVDLILTGSLFSAGSMNFLGNCTNFYQNTSS